MRQRKLMLKGHSAVDAVIFAIFKELSRSRTFLLKAIGKQAGEECFWKRPFCTAASSISALAGQYIILSPLISCEYFFPLCGRANWCLLWRGSEIMSMSYHSWVRLTLNHEAHSRPWYWKFLNPKNRSHKWYHLIILQMFHLKHIFLSFPFHSCPPF